MLPAESLLVRRNSTDWADLPNEVRQLILRHVLVNIRANADDICYDKTLPPQHLIGLVRVAHSFSTDLAYEVRQSKSHIFLEHKLASEEVRTFPKKAWARWANVSVHMRGALAEEFEEKQRAARALYYLSPAATRNLYLIDNNWKPSDAARAHEANSRMAYKDLKTRHPLLQWHFVRKLSEHSVLFESTRRG